LDLDGYTSSFTIAISQSSTRPPLTRSPSCSCSGGRPYQSPVSAELPLTATGMTLSSSVME
jgi:hypothetical protein